MSSSTKHTYHTYYTYHTCDKWNKYIEYKNIPIIKITPHIYPLILTFSPSLPNFDIS